MSEIQITEEEKKALFAHQRAVNDAKAALGSLRRSYLVSENRLIAAIVQAENTFTDYLKQVAAGYNIAEDAKDWVLDLSTFSFRKEPQE